MARCRLSPLACVAVAALALALSAVAASAAVAAPRAAPSLSVVRAVDPHLPIACGRALSRGSYVALCDAQGRERLSVARGAGRRALVPGRSIRLVAPRAGQRAQLALVYRSGGRHVYVRFSNP